MTPQEKFHIEYALTVQLIKRGWAEKDIYELIQQLTDGADTKSLNTNETHGEFLLSAFPKAIIRRRTLSYDTSKCSITVSFDGIHDQTFDQTWWTTPLRSVKTDTEAEPIAKPTTTECHTVPTKIRFKDAPLMHTLDNGYIKVLKINNERCPSAKCAPSVKSNALILENNHLGVICNNTMFYDRGIVPEDIEAYNKRLKEGVRF